MSPTGQKEQPIRLLAIVGPTAVGKTAFSVGVGAAHHGEVISADSRQIYRRMDIGTAKATLEEQCALPHHLIDVVDPDQELTLAHYVRMATKLVQEINARGHLPILVGGTGLYVRAVLEGWTVPEVPPDPDLRTALMQFASDQGHQTLHDRLEQVDPQAAAKIDARNVRRVIRAIEVFETTGHPISELQRKEPPDWQILRVGLTMSREQLYERIDARIDQMMLQGLEHEVRGLVSAGYGWDLASMSGLGYRQFEPYLRDEASLEETIALIRKHTRRFVRQQYNWFRLSDPSIQWFDLDAMTMVEAIAQTSTFLQQWSGDEGVS